jgi:signal transduction histidine kinase
MRDSYKRQIASLFDESIWQYAGDVAGTKSVNLGPLEGLYAIVGEQLRTSAIDTRFTVELLLPINSELKVVSRLGDNTESLRTLSVDSSVSPVTLRLIVEDPHSKILSSLRGMIIISLLTTLLLIFTFIYILRTLFRAKTLEHIRRDLTHNITHELRTPIAAARAAVDTLRSTPEIAQSEALREEYLAMTRSELDRLGVMVDSILRSSFDDDEPTRLRPESVQLQAIVDDVLSSLRLKYSSREIDFSSDITDDTSVWVDRASLQVILQNIVDNSIKYSEGVAKIKIVASSKDDKTLFSVEDEGVGIDHREQKRVFDKFYRVTSAYRQNSQGYGIGLYHVRTLVERNGGSIELWSAPKQGTKITVTLPKHG